MQIQIKNLLPPFIHVATLGAVGVLIITVKMKRHAASLNCQSTQINT